MGNDSTDVKELFTAWLEEAAVEATRKGTKAVFLYNKALGSIRRHQGPIEDSKTLKELPYIGDKTLKYLHKKLEEHCASNNIEVPHTFRRQNEDGKPDSAAQSTRVDSEVNQNKKKRRVTKRYIPKKRSGGYAIMIALYLGDKRRNGMSKDEIIQFATPYSERSFKSNPSGHDFYSAWSSIKSLLSHDLVGCSGRMPKKYFLTDEGYVLAKQLKETEGIESSPVNSNFVDFSFDNNVRVSPNSSYNSSLLFSSSPIASKMINLPKRLEISDDRSILNRGILSSPLKDYSLTVNSEKDKKDCFNDSLVQKDSNDSKKHDPENKVYDGVRYDIWTFEEFEIVLIIDNREIRSQLERDFFRNRITDLGILCEVRPLAVGDVVWIARHKKTNREVALNYICERKRLDDLASSIKDGRFKEQKSRLKRSGMKHYYYLVEEMVAGSSINTQDMSEAIQTSLSSTMLVSDFYIKKFRSIEDTIIFLASLTNVISRQLEKNGTRLLVLKPKAVNNHTEYIDLIQNFRLKFERRKTSYECVCLFSSFQEAMTKTGTTTLKELFIAMLMAIRGVSLERAVVLQNYFQTPKRLLEFFHIDNAHLSESEKKVLLHNIFSTQIGNKKIGKALLEKIYEVWGSK